MSAEKSPEAAPGAASGDSSRGLRSRLALIAAGLVLVTLLAAVVHPTVRARYHLKRATPAEVVINDRGELRLTGHALSFAESSAAAELLPEVVTRALEEGQRDDVVFYRALVFSIVKDGEPLSNDGLSVCVLATRSRDRRLRATAIQRLPLEPRTLSVHLERLEKVCRAVASGVKLEVLGDAVDRTFVRLAKFAYEHQDLVGGRTPEGRFYTDEPWDTIVAWERFWAENPKIASAEPREPDVETARQLKEWLEKNRAKLPEQLR